MQEKENRKLKIVIVILSVLLALSLLLLARTLIYGRISETRHASVTLPDNIITPEKESSAQPTVSGENNTAGDTSASAQTSNGGSGANETATVLSLHSRNTGDNMPFRLGNMFPGDSETKYYCVSVAHRGDVVLRFRADVRDGYEKLAEVLYCRIVLPESSEVLYDGLMRDMPESLNRELRTSSRTTSEVYYEITAYLDTGVGNEYMNKQLIADFRWWVEETGNLDAPQTGDTLVIYVWSGVAAGSLLLLILLWLRRKKEGESDE